MTITQCAHHWIIETPDGPIAKGNVNCAGKRGNLTTLWTLSIPGH